jgi:hypothetical protein
VWDINLDRIIGGDFRREDGDTDEQEDNRAADPPGRRPQKGARKAEGAGALTPSPSGER